MGAALNLQTITLFLFDIDGVFLEGKSEPRLIAGRRTLEELVRRGMPFRLLTNTSTHSRAEEASSLQKHGLPVEASHIHSALEATVAAAAARFPGGRCFVFGEPGLSRAAAEAGLRLVAGPPAELVLVGLNRQGDYSSLSRAAGCLRAGAQLIGCHRNKLWHDDDGLCVSVGPWLAALEQATGARATTYGKPSREFYERALLEVGIPAGATLMLGDDLEADVAGAQRAGLHAGVVLSGKTSRAALDASDARPELVLAHVDELVALLGGV